MPVFIFIGWIAGLLIGVAATLFSFIAFGLSAPPFLGALASLLTPIVASLAPLVAVAIAVFFVVASFLIAYLIATAAIAPLLSALTGVPTLTFPLPGPLPTPGGAPVTTPPTSGEFFGRGMLIGPSAAMNILLLSLLGGPLLSIWAFVVISLGTIIGVARNRIYQGFLG